MMIQVKVLRVPTPIDTDDGQTYDHLVILSDQTDRVELQSTLTERRVERQITETLTSHLYAPIEVALKIIEDFKQSVTQCEAAKKQKEWCQQQFSMLRSACIQISSQVNDHVDFTDIQRNMFTSMSERFELVPALDDITQSYNVLFQNKCLSLTISLHQHLPTTIVSDKSRLQQVVRIILQNSL
jgi:signal transduction histidine kinase